MSFAFMPLYTGDYRRDTAHLDCAEHGIYLLLLMHCWDQKGPLPLDERKLAGICGARSGSEIEAMRRILREFFVAMDDGWYNQRMQREVGRAEALSGKRKAAGIKGFQAKAKQVLSKSSASATTPTPTPTTTPTTSKTLSAKADGAWVEFWNAYPRKTAKQTALKSWRRIREEEVPAIMAALEKHRQSDQWARGVIPHPATWLNQRRWEDDLVVGEDLGQCMWNLNGTRGEGGRCERQAVVEKSGIVYCREHAGKVVA